MLFPAWNKATSSWCFGPNTNWLGYISVKSSCINWNTGGGKLRCVTLENFEILINIAKNELCSSGYWLLLHRISLGWPFYETWRLLKYDFMFIILTHKHSSSVCLRSNHFICILHNTWFNNFPISCSDFLSSLFLSTIDYIVFPV